MRLPVDIEAVPRVGVLDARISLEDFLEEDTFDGDFQMDAAKVSRNGFRCQLELNGREISSTARTVVHQMRFRAGDFQTFLHHLRSLNE